MKIGLAQILSTPSPTENLQQITDYATAAAEQGAEVVVFPEAAMCAFGNDINAVAEPLNGPWSEAIKSLAVNLDIVIVVGMFTPGANSKVRNTLLIAAPDHASSYTKTHLFDAYSFKESDAVEPGTKPHIIDIQGTKVGFGICYDIRFPQLFLQNAQEGAVVHIVPTSWGRGDGKAEQWELLTRARALDTTSYIVAVDQADPATTGAKVEGNAPTGIGLSAVVDPFGRDVIRMNGSPQLTVVDLDLNLVNEARSTIPVLENQVNFQTVADETALSAITR